LLSYDLNQPGQNYKALSEAIERQYPTHWHCLQSQWIVVTSSNAEAVCKSLLPYIDSSDKMIVSLITNDTSWYGLSQAGTEWLRDKLRKAA